MTKPTLYVGELNPLLKSYWNWFDERTRDAVCPDDDLITLQPVPLSSSETAAQGGAAGGPGRRVDSGVRRDDEASAPSSSCPPILTGGPQCNPLPLTTERPDDMPRFSGGYDGGCRVHLWGEWFDGDERALNLFLDDLKLHKDAAVDADENDGDDVYI